MISDTHFHLESLEAFTQELSDAGFSPVSGTNSQKWTGDAHPAFKPLTDATTMDVVIMPGWPYRPPVLLVQGLDSNHLTLDGFVCLWTEGDASLEWTTVEGLCSRIEQWCENALRGWEDDNLGLDALLNFTNSVGLVALFDLETLGVKEGGWGEFHGALPKNPPRVGILPGQKETPDQLRGMWFHVGQLRGTPPRRLSEVLRLLPRAQRKGLQKALDERRKQVVLEVSGGVDLILFCWARKELTDLLVLAVRGMAGDLEAVALQPGPIDEHSLIMRAGADAATLRSLNATVFGAGALGGHAAMLLAQSGIGLLRIVDPDVLLPGNVVRHVAGHMYAGAAKVQAVQAEIMQHAPWTQVECFPEPALTPGDFRKHIGDADVVIDATGNEALTGSLAMIAESLRKPMVAGALYRGGSIGRLQRQALSDDTPLHQRQISARYPEIPAGVYAEDFATPLLGCSAPVNNAPPSSVSACAALITQAAIDVLTGRFDLADEVIDVYRPLPHTALDRMGRHVPKSPISWP